MSAIWLLVGLLVGAVAVAALLLPRLRDSFRALSADALQRNSAEFMQLAQTQLTAAQTESKTELERREKAVEQLVAPLREQLGKVDDQLARLERDRQRSQGALGEQ